MPPKSVDGYLEQLHLLGEGRHELVLALRAHVIGMGAPVSEEVKYGGLLFSAGKPICGIFPYTKHVSLEFGSGAFLDDRYGVLEGDGKHRRHIKLFSIQDIPGKHVQEYIALAFKASALR